MQKPLTYKEKGLLGKNSITRILPQSRTINKVISELLYYTKSGYLTQAIDLLEKRGITGDTAIFIIATLQAMGAQR